MRVTARKGEMKLTIMYCVCCVCVCMLIVYERWSGLEEQTHVHTHKTDMEEARIQTNKNQVCTKNASDSTPAK